MWKFPDTNSTSTGLLKKATNKASDRPDAGQLSALNKGDDMAARDRYEKTVSCHQCNEKGVIHISENDYPFMKRLDKSIDSVEGEFDAKISGDTHLEVTCRKCGAPIS